MNPELLAKLNQAKQALEETRVERKRASKLLPDGTPKPHGLTGIKRSQEFKDKISATKRAKIAAGQTSWTPEAKEKARVGQLRKTAAIYLIMAEDASLTYHEAQKIYVSRKEENRG